MCMDIVCTPLNVCISEKLKVAFVLNNCHLLCALANVVLVTWHECLECHLIVLLQHTVATESPLHDSSVHVCVSPAAPLRPKGISPALPHTHMHVCS